MQQDGEGKLAGKRDGERDGERDGQAESPERWRAFVRACNPMPQLPIAACVVAVALWCGAAAAEAIGWTAWTVVPAMTPLRGALLLSALLIAAISAAAGVQSIRVRGSAMRPTMRPAVPIIVVGISGVLLGAGLRIREAAKLHEVTRIELETGSGSRRMGLAEPRGQLVQLEATVRTRPTLIAEGSDLLARYFKSPPRLRFELNEVVFKLDSGRLVPLRRDLVLLASMPEPNPDRPSAWSIGTRLSIHARMRIPGPTIVPSDREWSDAMHARGAVGSIAIESTSLVEPIAGWRSSTPLMDAILELRAEARERARAALLSGMPEQSPDDRAIRAMIVALVLGDAEEGYRALEEDFRAVGLAHILAISGFNLTVLAWVAATAASMLVRDPRAQAVVVAVAALAALCLMVPAASAVRSAWMAVIGATGASVRRDWNGDAVLAVVAVAMLVHEPSNATQVGFQLSFLCVIALRHIAPEIRRRWMGWLPVDDGRHRCHASVAIASEFASRAVAAGIAAFLTSLPVVLLHFGSCQPLSILWTLLCTPLSTATLVIAYPKCLLGFPWPALSAWMGPVLWLPAWLQASLADRALLAFGAPLETGAIGLPWCLAALCGLCFGFFPQRRLVRAAGLAMFTAAVLIAPKIRPEQRCDGMEVTMFAVGDGSAYLVESAGSVVVFDAGSSSTSHVASRALLPAISDRGGVVDALFISHPNLDHFSAALNIVRHAHVREVLIHPRFLDAAGQSPAVEAFLAELARTGVRRSLVDAGDRIDLGDMECSVLWPDHAYRSRKANDLSLVVQVTHGASGARMLFCGDIETEPAARLAARSRRGEIDIKSDIVELPHHGSWREAVVELLREAAPRIVLQSTAWKRFESDRFGEHIPGGCLRFVTCRDASIQVRGSRDGRLDCFRWAGRQGWVPAGTASARVGSSPWRDDARATQHHGISSHAVPTIPNADCDGGRGFGSGIDTDLFARIRCVEPQSLRWPGAERDFNIDARVSGERLPQRHLAREDAGGGRRTALRLHREPGLERTVDLDARQAEHGALDRLDPHSILEAEMKLAGRNRNRGPPEGSEWNQTRRAEDGCNGIRGRIVVRALATHARKACIRQCEAPSVRAVVSKIRSVDHRTVDRPEPGEPHSGLLGLCERDGGSPVERDGALLADLPGGLEDDALADRVDESGQDVAVEKKQGVRVQTPSGNGRAP